MSRRPYIDQSVVRDDLYAIATHNTGYSRWCSQYEPVGMDGRNDWFRWHCRDCNRKFISPRMEKRQKYYKCPDCDTLHHVSKGFFTQPDRSGGSETVPLRPSEVAGPLIRFTGYYKRRDDESVFYGGVDYLQDKVEGDFWNITAAYRVHEDGMETLLTEGEIEALK